MKTKCINEDWEILKKLLPNGWETKATELGALVRKRKITSADTLLRVLLIHFADGKSLRTTAAYAQETNLCDVNDVSLLHRLGGSGNWLKWIADGLIKSLDGPTLPGKQFKKFRIRLVDGSVIKEPGSTGTDWRIHYSYQIDKLRCDTCKITSPKIGETFLRYDVQENDLLVGDRGYCHRKGITHIIGNGGQVLVRFHSTNLPLYKRNGKPFDVLAKLRLLTKGKAGDWDVWFKDPENDNLVKGRLCSIKKGKEAREKAIKKLRQTASKQGRKLKPATIEHAKYITLFTTVNRHNLKKGDILSLYRVRWQIELIFKRLKGIIGIGHLPKFNAKSCIAWLYGKMVVALLVERIYQEAESFSPWGYPIE